MCEKHTLDKTRFLPKHRPIVIEIETGIQRHMLLTYLNSYGETQFLRRQHIRYSISLFRDVRFLIDITYYDGQLVAMLNLNNNSLSNWCN